MSNTSNQFSNYSNAQSDWDTQGLPLMHFIMQWQGRGENAELLEFSKNTVPVVSNLLAPGAQGAP